MAYTAQGLKPSEMALTQTNKMAAKAPILEKTFSFWLFLITAMMAVMMGVINTTSAITAMIAKACAKPSMLFANKGEEVSNSSKTMLINVV
jgi:hypothetical protein